MIPSHLILAHFEASSDWHSSFMVPITDRDLAIAVLATLVLVVLVIGYWLRRKP